MKQLTVLSLIYLAAIGQTSLRSELTVGAAVPNFMWLALVGIVLCSEGWPAIIWAALVGLLADCIAGGPIGSSMVAASMVVAVVQSVRQTRFPQLGLIVPLSVCFVVFAAALTSWLADVMAADRSFDRWAAVVGLVLDAAYTSLLGLAAIACWCLIKRVLPLHRSEIVSIGSAAYTHNRAIGRGTGI